MTTENTNELNDLDNNVINVINQLKKWKKRTDVYAILNQIIKNDDCVDINKDFLAARLNYLLEHNVIVKKKYNNIESYSLYENTQTRDLTEILSSCTPDIQIPDASIDPNEVVINATPEVSPNIPTIDTPTCSNLPYNCPSQPYSLTSLKQNYLDLCAQSVDVKEFLFREICFLKNKLNLYEQKMDHVMSNFGNINNKTELEMKVSLLEKENFELRDQLINKLLIIKELKTDSKSNPSPTHISTTTNTITKPAQTNDNINSNNNNKNNNNNNNNNSNCKSKNNDNNNKNKTDNNSTNEKAVYSKKLQVQLEEIRKEKHTIFLNLKAYEEQADLVDLSQINKSNEYINSAQINSKAVDVKWPKGTVAIVGDSIMSGIREELLKTDKHNVKVRFFRGGTIEDMEDNIKPVLKREPDYIILHVGTNNATNSTARDILDKLLQLKSKIINARKSCKVIISQPTLRSDNGKAALTNHHICNLLEELNIDIVKNRNIGSKHLGGKGLHLNPHGTARLALNLKAAIRKL